jgi:class 3 adenylate cyclase
VESPDAVTRFTGTFADPELERAFLAQSYTPEARNFLRFSVFVGTVAFAAYGLHDYLVLEGEHLAAWKIRFGVFLPVAACCLALLTGEKKSPLLAPALMAFATSTTFVAVWIGALGHGPARLLYTSYAPLFVIMGPFFLRMSVAQELTFTVLTLAAYLGFDVALGHSNAVLVTSMSATLVTMGGIGALVAKEQAAEARRSFAQQRTIEAQIAALNLERQRSEELLLNVLPKSIADRLKGSNSAIADGFAEVSVLFADIVGFTKMSERIAPAALVERLNSVFSSFDDLADKLRLEKIKTIGDAYMVAGGLNLERHDHAEALAEMALAMQRRVTDFGHDFGEALSLRIGIHTGPAVAGVIGKKKFIYDVWGDTVNTASRMESHGEPGTIQVTEAVQQRLSPKYEFAYRGEIDVKGKGRMRTWFLTGRRGVNVQKTHLPWEG